VSTIEQLDRALDEAFGAAEDGATVLLDVRTEPPPPRR
jgi:hypothetical protein